MKKNIRTRAYIMFQVSGESRARLFELEMVNGVVTRTECYPGRVRGSTNSVVYTPTYINEGTERSVVEPNWRDIVFQHDYIIVVEKSAGGEL